MDKLQPDGPGTKRKRILRVLLPCLAALCALGIFASSSLSGTASGGMSQQVAVWVTGQEDLPPDSQVEGVIRKLGHLAEFALLGLLLYLAFRAWGRLRAATLGWPLLAGLAVAVCDETIQLYVPGRHSSVLDVWLDGAGVLLGMMLGLAAAAVLHRARRKKRGAPKTARPISENGKEQTQ